MLDAAPPVTHTPTPSETEERGASPGPLRVDKLIGWWVGPEPDLNRSSRNLLLLITLLAICTAIFALGVPRLRAYGHDVFFCLDGAWRTVNGQRPVLDFFAVVGPAWYLLYAAALKLARNDARALCYGSTLVAVLMSAWSFLLLRRRMEPAPCFLACVSVVLLSVSPFALGKYPIITSFAMMYNRLGYGLVSLVLLECYLPSSDQDSFGRQFGGGFSSGLACAAMTFVKISYGPVGLALIAVSLVLRPRERARWLGLIAGFAIFVLPMLAYLRFDVAALVREYRFLAPANRWRFSFPSALRSVWEGRFEFAPPILATLLVALFAAPDARRRLTLGAACLLGAGGGTLLLITNAQASDLPPMAAVALLLVNEVTSAGRRRGPGMHHPHPVVTLTLLGFGLLAAGIPLSLDAAGLGYALADKSMPRQPGYRLSPPHLSALEFVEVNPASTNCDNGAKFVRYTEEGMDLVKAHSGAKESVTGLIVNPFSYALLRPPSPGGSNAISSAVVGEKSMPPFLSIVGDVDLIMIPTYPADEEYAMKLVLSTYHDTLEREYVVEAQSPHWTLLRKRALHTRDGEANVGDKATNAPATQGRPPIQPVIGQ